MTTNSTRTKRVGRYLLAMCPLWPVACGSNAQTPIHPLDGSSSPSVSDAGASPTSQTDGASTQSAVDAMASASCTLPAAPTDPCGAVPTGKVTPCGQDGGQPSQTGYLEIDSPESPPIYVCATSWSSEPSIGYIFGQPATFLTDPQGCCGGTVSPAPSPTVPDTAIGSLGAPHIPSHVKPQELKQPGSGPLRQNPFAVTVTDTSSGAAAVQAMSTWLSWGGDGQPHSAPDGLGSNHFASGFPINYVILETGEGFPIVVIGPEVNLTADGTTPIGHPTLGVCPAGGGAALAMIGGEVRGTTLNNHSGRFDYGPGPRRRRSTTPPSCSIVWDSQSPTRSSPRPNPTDLRVHSRRARVGPRPGSSKPLLPIHLRDAAPTAAY